MRTGFRLGGVFQNLGPLPFQAPPKNIFPESKNFSGRCWRRVDVIFSKTKESFPKQLNLSQNKRRNFSFKKKFFSANKSFIFKKNCNSSIPGPPPSKLGPLFYFFFGWCYTPPPPHTYPRWHGPEPITSACELFVFVYILKSITSDSPSSRLNPRKHFSKLSSIEI